MKCDRKLIFAAAENFDMSTSSSPQIPLKMQKMLLNLQPSLQKSWNEEDEMCTYFNIYTSEQLCSL